MTVVIEISDEVATRIAATGEDVQRFTFRAALGQLQRQEAAPDARDDEKSGRQFVGPRRRPAILPHPHP